MLPRLRVGFLCLAYAPGFLASLTRRVSLPSDAFGCYIIDVLFKSRGNAIGGDELSDVAMAVDAIDHDKLTVPVRSNFPAWIGA